MLKTLQDRLPNELALQRIAELEAAKRFLGQTFLPAFNPTGDSP